MSPSKIMMIRHGEKPSKDGLIRGVAPAGVEDAESLSVLGWQRAGALGQFFRAGGPEMLPTALFAAAAGGADSSKRPAQTLSLLSDLLGLEIQDPFAIGQEVELATQVRQTPGVVLVAWEHKALHLIANAIVGDDRTVPQLWPGDRFDILWTFVPEADNWSFRASGQHLLPGDRDP